MGEKFNNLINSINFKSNDNNDLDSKVNNINKEISTIAKKMKDGKDNKKIFLFYFFIFISLDTVEEYISELNSSQNDAITIIKKNLIPNTPFSMETQELAGDSI